MEKNKNENQGILQTLALISEALAVNPFGNSKLSITIKVNSHEYNSILNEVEKFTRISSPQQNNNKFSIEIDDLTFVFSKEVD
mgnify:CR=1 FL=1